MIASAANGDDWAKGQLERVKARKCSFCKSEDHNLARCLERYNQDLLEAKSDWAGTCAAISIIKEKKIATGAFLYGPLPYRYYSTPQTNRDGTHSYEYANFIISRVNVQGVRTESTGYLKIDTLAEPEKVNQRFTTEMSIPGLYRKVLELSLTATGPLQEGAKTWIRKIDGGREHPTDKEMRDLSVSGYDVISEATEEEVHNTVSKFMDLKPLILKYSDAESYWKANRAAKKELKTKVEV